MGSLRARLMGFSREHPLSIEAAVMLIAAGGVLSRQEACVLLLDYLGFQRSEIRSYLSISDETVTTYWKRIYQKTQCRGRAAARRWLEALLQRELEVG